MCVYPVLPTPSDYAPATGATQPSIGGDSAHVASADGSVCDSSIVDSAATKHLMVSGTRVRNKRSVPPFQLQTAGKRHVVSVRELGTINLTKNIRLDDVMVVPEAAANLISVPAITATGKYTVWFTKDYCDICTIAEKVGGQRVLGRTILRVPRSGNLYVHNQKDEEPTPSVVPPSTGTITRRVHFDSSPPAGGSTSTAARAGLQRHGTNRNQSANVVVAANGVHTETAFFAFGEEVQLAGIAAEDQSKLWHARLAHPSPQVMVELNHQLKLGLTNKSLRRLADCVCIHCIQSKSRRTKSPPSAPTLVPLNHWYVSSLMLVVPLLSFVIGVRSGSLLVVAILTCW